MQIKLYKKLTAIKLKDWEIITTELPVQSLAKMLNENDFIIIWWVGFWKFEVKTFKEFDPTEVDSFIYTQPSPKKERLMKILKEREEKNFNTESVEHLLRIYGDRYWEIK